MPANGGPFCSMVNLEGRLREQDPHLHAGQRMAQSGHNLLVGRLAFQSLLRPSKCIFPRRRLLLVHYHDTNDFTCMTRVRVQKRGK